MTIPNIILSILSDMKASGYIADFTYQTPGKSNVVASQMECPMAILSTFTDFLISSNRRSESAEVNLFFLNRQTLDFDGVEDLNNPDKKGTPEDLCFNFLNRLTQYKYLETENVKMSSTFDSNDTNLTGYALQMRITDKRSFCIDDEEGTRSTLYVNSNENGVVEYDVAGFSKAVVSTNVTQPEPEWPEYMRITALETTTVDYSHYVTSAEYSINGGEWVKFQNPPYVFSLNAGDYAEFRSFDTCYDFGIVRFNFKILGKANLSGRLGSMLNPKLEGDVPTQAFGYLFRNCTGIFYVDPDFLEGLSFSYYSLSHLFDGCTNLTNVPNLPDGIRLSALSGMFKNCKSLTDGGVLPATDIEAWGYENLYYGCENLSRLTCYLDEISSPKCSHWLDGVAPTGVLRCPASTYIYEGMLPEGWTRENI